MTHLALGPGPEFDRIRAIIETLGGAAEGLGDDAAVLSLGRGIPVASIDLAVENVHFKRDWITPHEIGWRSAMAALSDLAAMGADASALLASVGAPASWSSADIVDVMQGVADACQGVGAKVIGGDLSRADQLILDCCVIGVTERPVRRAGARPGDRVWVTGRLGGPGAAIAAWGRRDAPLEAHRARYARPEARLAAGQWLAARGATAMIDVSDGLAADATHLAAASGLKVILELDRVPVVEGVDDRRQAAASGEEYELLVTLGPSFVEISGAPAELTAIGWCERGEGVEARLGGESVTVPAGWDHFRT